MRRLVLLLAAMALALMVASGVAFADPVNSPKAPIVTLDCDNGEEVKVTFLLNSSAIFNVVDTTGNFVLTRVEGTATFTDPETGEVEEFEFSIGQGQRKGQQDSLTTCDTTITFQDPELGPVTVDFTFTGFFTPRQG